MAGLETVIRPIVNPDFRPRARPKLDESEDEPFTLNGGDGNMLSLSHSLSVSWSHSVETETRRVYDVHRVHNPDDEDQFVDVEVVTKLETKDAKGNKRKVYLGRPPAQDNIERLSSNNTRVNNG